MDPAVDAIVRSGFALLLLSAARHKLRAFADFRSSLADYRIVPAPLGGAASAGLVAAELATGAALLAPPARDGALLAASFLLALYGAAIATNLVRGRRHIDCGCAGPGRRQPIGGALVARNAVLAAAALAAGVARPFPRALTWVDGVTVVAGVGALAALYAALQRLSALAPAAARARS